MDQWRDDVNERLGRLDERTAQILSRLDRMDERLDDLSKKISRTHGGYSWLYETIRILVAALAGLTGSKVGGAG